MLLPDMVLHADADAFYAACECARFAELLGVPVVVVGNQGACVIAKSYEAKAYGIRTGMPIWDAVPLCPDVVVVKRDFVWYETLSRKMLEIVKRHSDTVEYYSIDEFFGRVCLRPGRTLRGYALAIQAEIMAEVGVPVSIGIGRSRTLAKLVSDTVKPFGVGVLVDEAEEREFLGKTPVKEISGVGGRREKRLAEVDITTCLDLADADRRLVRRLLTASGEALWWELHGDQVQAIHVERPRRKIVARGGSFGVPTDDPMTIYAWFARNLERLIEQLQYDRRLASKLDVWVRYRGERPNGAKGTTNLARPSDRFDDLLEAGTRSLRRAFLPGRAADRMHVVAQRIHDREPVQLGLYTSHDHRADVIADIKRRVNARHGRFTLRTALTLPLRDVYKDDANDHDICDVQDKTCF